MGPRITRLPDLSNFVKNRAEQSGRAVNYQGLGDPKPSDFMKLADYPSEIDFMQLNVY